MSFDVVDLGGSELSAAGVPVSQCKGAPSGDGEAPDYGQVPLMCALGLAARPAPPDSSGSAQGIVTDTVPGFEAACVAAFDPRTADTYQQLGPGETAVFSTGGGYDSRLLLKDQSATIICGDDTVIGIDRRAEKISLTGFGATIEITRGGIVLASGGAMIRVGGGVVSLVGAVVLGGAAPSSPVLSGSPSTPVLSPGVFIGV